MPFDLLILHRPAPDRFEKTIAAYKALKAPLANGDQWSYANRDRVTAALVLRVVPDRRGHREDALGDPDGDALEALVRDRQDALAFGDQAASVSSIEARTSRSPIFGLAGAHTMGMPVGVQIR